MNKIKILYLLDFFPFPENKDGATKIMANILNRLSEEYEISLICTASQINIAQIPERITFHHEPIEAQAKTRIVNRLTFNLPGSLSNNQIKHIFDKYQLNHFDIVHTAIQSFSRLEKLTHIFFGINDSISRTAHDGTVKGQIKYLYNRLVERNLSKRNITFCVVSKNDAWYYDSKKTIILPNGVDSSIFSPIQNDQRINSFVFHGVLDYQPNIDSIKHMSGLLKKISPDLRLNLIGRMNRSNPNETVAIYNSLGNCTIIGEVEDISREIGKYSWYLALMSSGAGIKNKVLEAMSSGMVVLVNQRGIEGLTNHEELLNAVYLIENENDIEFAMDDQENWRTKSENARSYVKSNYSWDRYMEKLDQAYKAHLPKN